jgi:hypothetical protein
MLKLKSIFISGLLTLIVSLTLLTAILVITDMRAAQADIAPQPVIAAENNSYYLPLTDAPPQRDITDQRFAPLEVTP